MITTTKRLGCPPLSADLVEQIQAMLRAGRGVPETARARGGETAMVQRIKYATSAGSHYEVAMAV